MPRIPTGTFLNEAGEWHALFHGFWASVYSLEPRPRHSDSVDEPHYYRLGYLLGDLVQLLGIVAIAYLLTKL